MLNQLEAQIREADHQISGITAADLMRKTFPEPRWAVPNLLTEGVNILAGKPKKGKSILALNLGISIPLGGLALGQIPVEKGAAIILALEDTERRLQGRLRQMLYGDTAPASLHLFTHWPRMDAGGLELLEAKIQEIPDVRFVVIDTLQRFRKPMRNNGNLYSEDYEAVAQIKDIADRLGVCILLIHHLRKAQADDPFDTLSGSLGLTGGADGILVMENSKGNTILHVTGRDVEEAEYAIELDRQMLTWRLLGERSEVKTTSEQQLVYNTIKEASEALSPKEIADISGVKIGTVKKILSKFMSDQSIHRTTYGRYTTREII
ncbi:MAG: AAA family ATPase [Desulfomonilia bacterium]